MSSVNELSELANRACDGTLSAADLDRLETLLREDQRNRPLYLRFVHMHALLSWRYRTGPESNNPQFASTELEALQVSEQETLAPPSRRYSWDLPHLAQRIRSRRWAWGFAVATSLAFAAILWNFASPDSKSVADSSSLAVEPKSKSVATLRESTHAVWTGRGRAIDVGSRIETDTLKVEAGEAELIFDSGARLVLAGPTELRIESPLAVYLISGTIAAHMPETAIGFKVQTPTSTFVDQGTEFGVVADRDGTTELHVFRGRVDLHYDSPEAVAGGAGGRLALMTRQARRVEMKGSPGRDTTFSRARFGRLAQRVAEPVKWKISDGGNDHFYQLMVADTPLTWHEAARRAMNSHHRGWPGHLVSITSRQEDEFVIKRLLVETDLRGAWMGLTDMLRESSHRWITGEAFGFANWSTLPTQQPDNFREFQGHGGEDYGVYTNQSGPLGWAWNDLSNDGIYETVSAYVVEFEPPVDALCDGSMASEPLLWRVEDGGNGNAYQLIVAFESTDWQTIRDHARSRSLPGFHSDLVSLDTPGEFEFVRDHIVRVCSVPDNMIGLSGSMVKNDLRWCSGLVVKSTVDVNMPNLPADQIYGLLRWDAKQWLVQARAAHVLPEGWFGYLVEYRAAADSEVKSAN